MAKKEENELKKEIVKEMKDKVLVELNKEIKTTLSKEVNQYKEDLEQEMMRAIDEEVENVMKREEKRILRNRSFSLFKKNVFILILLVLVGYFGYCLYDARYFDFMKSECEKNGTCVDSSNSSVSGEVKEEVIKDKNWYINNYGYLLNTVQTKLNADQASAYYLYIKDYNVNDIKPAYLLNLAYQQIEPENIKTNTVNVTVDENIMKAAFEKLFGSLENYKETAFTYDCLQFKYDKDKKRYVADNNKCSANKQILENISDMYEEDNKLYILTTATIYDANEESFYSFDDLYEPVVQNVTINDLETNAKKLNKYQYIFKKADDNYYFDSITKLK